MSEHPSSVGEPTPGGAFGPNAWLVDDMYDQFRRDPQSVSESWREFFADYVPGGHGGLAGSGSPGNESAFPRDRRDSEPGCNGSERIGFQRRDGGRTRGERLCGGDRSRR